MLWDARRCVLNIFQIIDIAMVDNNIYWTVTVCYSFFNNLLCCWAVREAPRRHSIGFLLNRRAFLLHLSYSWLFLIMQLLAELCWKIIGLQREMIEMCFFIFRFTEKNYSIKIIIYRYFCCSILKINQPVLFSVPSKWSYLKSR